MTATDPLELAERIAATAVPPAVFGRIPLEERVFDILLDDLVEAHAVVDPAMKEEFIRVFVDDGDLDDPDPEYPEDELTQGNLRAFAAMEPKIDLEALLEAHRANA